ncbi:MAG: GIY-YIG nuclease family protein [Stenotrophomonas sp.]|nr:GIY-YIG nuclease family protein [Stenotrophomonas sp.]
MPIRIDGHWFAYVFPCAWEDYCKIGFSRDPLGRISALHRRWFEFFDLEHGWLVEAETQRDARDLELELRGPLKLHRTPVPLTVQQKAGGSTEWVRGAGEALTAAVQGLAARGHHVYRLRPWLRTMLLQRTDRLYAWSDALLPEEESHRHARADIEAALRDALDAHEALGIDPRPWLLAHVTRWYG